MHETISADDARRDFDRILRDVREGHSYVVTCDGRAVAHIVPAGRNERVNAAAKAALLARLGQQPAIDVGCWTRDELYEDKG